MRRLENLCKYFKENMPKYKNSLRKVGGPDGFGRMDYSTGRTRLDPNKIVTAIKVDRDEEGHIVYPIIVTPTLRILNLGVVEYMRPAFHSARNLFPIGFKSVREYTSMFYPNKRCEYMCEILDGGNEPLFKVTASDDPSNPMIKASSSGVWIDICKKINEL